MLSSKDMMLCVIVHVLYPYLHPLYFRCESIFVFYLVRRFVAVTVRLF